VLGENYEIESLYASSVVMATVLFIALDRLSLIYRYRILALEPLLVLIGAIFVVAALKIYIKAKLKVILYSDSCDSLITDGIYSKTRNPQYSSILFLSAGLILINSNMLLFLLIPLYYVFLSLVIIFAEERALEKAFNNEWIEYKNSVNRLIPIRAFRA